MNDVTISASFDSQYTFYQSDTRWIFSASVTGTYDAGPVVSGPSMYTGTEIILDGKLVSAMKGISVSAEATVINISKTGRIDAGDGVELLGANQSVTNGGTIIATNFGIYYSSGSHIVNNGKILSDFIGIAGLSDDVKIENNGLLKGHSGIYVGGNNVEIELGIKSRIIGTGENPIGIWAETSTEDFFKVENAGLIQADIIGGAGGSKITNTGNIIGTVRLNEGDDILDTSKGQIDGEIFGGSGNDTYVISTAEILINELQTEGADTIKSSVAISLESNIFNEQEIENLTLTGKAKINATGNELANVITGNKNNNIIKGGIGADTLNGGEGNDRLTGGGGHDNFVFKGGNEKDVITDFKDGDIVTISNWAGIDDYLDLLDHALNVGKSVVISSGNDSLTIENLHKGNLNQNDFDI
ncbi:MAG: hemolysin-type calcium-binding repeat family protein [Rhizobium sp.]|nr:hemolysin-type calcium-binding repeat family protein [Rhizobium sp.]